jgi:hypothetical protein
MRCHYFGLKADAEHQLLAQNNDILWKPNLRYHPLNESHKNAKGAGIHQLLLTMMIKRLPDGLVSVDQPGAVGFLVWNGGTTQMAVTRQAGNACQITVGKIGGA